jgi:hypothetical protein
MAFRVTGILLVSKQQVAWMELFNPNISTGRLEMRLTLGLY